MTVDIYNDPSLQVLSDAAEAVAYHWSEWLSFDDLYQEAWLWRLRHTALVNSFLEKEEPDVRGLERVIKSYLESVARKEKAICSGYQPDDEVFYTPRVVAELLPLTLDIEAALLPAAPPDGDKLGGTGNPHGSSDFVTSLLDVRNAWLTTAFRGDEMRLTEARYVDGWEWDRIAASYSTDVEEVKAQVARGLRRLSNTLGGLPPRSCPSSCECKEKGE